MISLFFLSGLCSSLCFFVRLSLYRLFVFSPSSISGVGYGEGSDPLFPPWPSLAFIKPEDGLCFFEKKQRNESLASLGSPSGFSSSTVASPSLCFILLPLPSPVCAGFFLFNLLGFAPLVLFHFSVYAGFSPSGFSFGFSLPCCWVFPPSGAGLFVPFYSLFHAETNSPFNGIVGKRSWT